MHADDAARMLPANVDLTPAERIALNSVLPMSSRCRDDARRREKLSKADFDAAVARLVELGLWKKTGCFTTAGRNARSVRWLI